MATKNVAQQASKKKSTGSLLRISCGASVTSSKCECTMKTRSMVKAAAPTAPKQTALAPSKLLDLKTQQKASSWMGEIQNTHLQSAVCKVEDYCSSNSSSLSPKGTRMSETEVESSKSIVMPSMMTGTTTLEEDMTNKKAILEKLTKDNEEKDVRIKLQEEKIAKLIKKLGKRLAQSSAKDGESEDSKNMSIHIEASDSEKQSKKAATPIHVKSSGSITIEQIQDLIANAVKAQLGEGSHRTLLYTKPYTKRVDALHMPHGYQPPKFQQCDGKGNLKQHVTHFIETCNNTGTDDDLMVKQFVRILKGIAFD